MYEVTFIKRNGEKIKAKGKEGDTLLDVVVDNNLDLEGYGAYNYYYVPVNLWLIFAHSHGFASHVGWQLSSVHTWATFGHHYSTSSLQT